MLHCKYTDLNEYQGAFVLSISFFFAEIETIDDKGRLQVMINCILFWAWSVNTE
jgi:hypothetical protein